MTALNTGLLFLLGAVLGSFANVCIWRLPRRESIVWPPSHCPLCREKLKPWHMVPIFSWFLLRGKCAYCGGGISLRYPLVEAATAAVFAAIGYAWGLSAHIRPSGLPTDRSGNCEVAHVCGEAQGKG